MQGAMQAVRDVHTTDELMHFEWLGPFWELNEVRPSSYAPHAYVLHSLNLSLNPHLLVPVHIV